MVEHGGESRRRPLGPAEAIAVLRSLDWDFADADTSHSGHAIHPYPAKFPPQLPFQLIEVLTSVGDFVVDCFGGSGTTALEAVRLGRRVASIDANPVALNVARVKLEADKRVGEDLLALADDLQHERASHGSCGCEGEHWRPKIPNVDKWYASFVMEELAHLRDFIQGRSTDVSRDAAMMAFAHVASRMSFQESETRYVAVAKDLAPGDATRRLVASLTSLANELMQRTVDVGASELICGDSREAASWPFPAGTVDLVITSPPYPNSYDYHLYHRFRLFWLGHDPRDLRSVEIGSHLRNQTDSDPLLSYELDMLMVLRNAALALRPGAYAAFVVGTGLFGGSVYETADQLDRLARLTGLEVVGQLKRQLPASRRSVTSAGRRLIEESICLYRRVPAGQAEAVEPRYSLHPYELVLADRERAVLDGPLSTTYSPLDSSFARAVEVGGGLLSTFQAIVETSGDDRGRSKNSTYAGHGLHQYKGKFYPQLAKSLINISQPHRFGGLVCDPFGGSGTVAVEALLAGYDVLSTDINPLAVSVARAKTGALRLPHSELLSASAHLRVELLKPLPSDEALWSEFEPETHEELVSWFPEAALRKLAQILSASRAYSKRRKQWGPVLQTVLEAVASDIVRRISHQEPSDLRIRRRAIALDDAPVVELFLRGLDGVVDAHRRLQSRLAVRPICGEAMILHGSSALATTFEGLEVTGRRISAVVSSPPYGTALPYLDTDRLSLAAIYGWSKERRKELERTLIGSREIGPADQREWERWLHEEAVGALPDSTVAFLRQLLADVGADPHAGFRRLQTPAVLGRYFSNMGSVLRNLSARMDAGSEVALVMGESRISVAGHQRTIATIDHVVQTAALAGFVEVERIPITVYRGNHRNSKNSITENDVVRLRRE